MRLSAAALVLATACSQVTNVKPDVVENKSAVSGVEVQDVSREKLVEVLSQRYFDQSLSEVRRCIEQVGYDLDLCVKEMIAPFIHESEPQLDVSVREAIIRAIRVRFSNIKLPEKKKVAPRVDEDETMV